MSKQKFKQVSEQEALESLFGRERPPELLQGWQQNKEPTDPRRRLAQTPEQLARLSQKSSRHAGWKVSVQGTKGEVAVGAQDFCVGLRVAHGLPLEASQKSRFEKRLQQGVRLDSPEVLAALRTRGKRTEMGRIERQVVGEKVGFDFQTASFINDRTVWSEQELLDAGLTLPQLSKWTQAGFLERHTQWSVDEETREIEATHRYSLGRHGVVSGVGILQDGGLSRERCRALLFVKGKASAKPVEVRARDCEIAQRLFLGLPLPAAYEKRLAFLREQGIKPESAAFRTAIELHPVFGRTTAKIERTLWLEKTGVNPAILTELNRYKQIPTGDLMAMGFQKTDLEILEKRGVIRRTTAIIAPHKTDPRPVEYVTLRASGKWAGVEFLIDQGMKHSDIQKWSQKRQDLLKHDLYVPRAAWAVSRELEEQGYRIVSIKNESQQYRDVMSRMSAADKQALMDRDGNLRAAFANQAFADVRITAVDAQGQTLEIDVEYGVYRCKRMEKKVASFRGDRVYVVGSSRTIDRYTKEFGNRCRASFRSIEL